METKITEQYFQYETNKYFRGNAHSLQLGSFGEKKDLIGAKAYLDVQDAIKPIYLASRVKYNTTTKIDWSQTNKTEVEAEGAFKFFGININAAVDGTYDKAKTAKLELINFAIDEGPLQRMLNEDADGARNYLAKEGNDGRVVSEVWGRDGRRFVRALLNLRLNLGIGKRCRKRLGRHRQRRQARVADDQARAGRGIRLQAPQS